MIRSWGREAALGFDSPAKILFIPVEKRKTMMTQVLPHDYGKGRFSLKAIRAAIKAVNAEKSASKEVIDKSTKSKIVRRNK